MRKKIPISSVAIIILISIFCGFALGIIFTMGSVAHFASQFVKIDASIIKECINRVGLP